MFQEDAEALEHERALVANALEGPIFPVPLYTRGSCTGCGYVIEEGRRSLGAVTCAECSVHSVHHTHR